MYRIMKQFAFSASHQLSGLPDDHPCSNLHGHNYVVEVELSGKTLNDIGFIVDYRKLEPFKRYIDDVLDHKHLNDVLSFNPTAENLARHLFEQARYQWQEVCAVRVSETPKTMAEYSE